MSWWSAQLFRAVQAAPFYRELHGAAVALLPEGRAQSWLDVGCGPGLLCRLAAERGYRVTGIDLDDAMLAAARGRAHPVDIVYVRSDLAELARSDRRADVVSASSLLAVLPEPNSGLRELAALLRPGGSLLIIEANELFGLRGAWRFLWTTQPRPSHALLLLWALLRGGRTVPPTVFSNFPTAVETVELLDGMVTARRITPTPLNRE